MQHPRLQRFLRFAHFALGWLLLTAFCAYGQPLAGSVSVSLDGLPTGSVYGSAGNPVRQLTVPPGSIITRVDWAGEVRSNQPSWLQEIWFEVRRKDRSVRQQFSVSSTEASGVERVQGQREIPGRDAVFTAGADGLLEVELFETFQDGPGDGLWLSGTLTVYWRQSLDPDPPPPGGPLPAQLLAGTVWPAEAGNRGTALLTVWGAGFDAEAACTLARGGQTVRALRAVPSPVASGLASEIKCLFDLQGLAAGDWTLGIRSGGGQSAQLPVPFRVVDVPVPSAAAAAAELWGNVRVPGTQLRAGMTHRLTVHYGNRGLNDVSLVPLLISWPARAGMAVRPQLAASPRLPEWPAGPAPAEPRPVEIEGRNTLLLLVNRIAARGWGQLPIDVTLPNSFQGVVDIDVKILPPWTQEFPAPTASTAGLRPLAALAPRSGNPDLSCLNAMLTVAQTGLLNALPFTECGRAILGVTFAVSAHDNFNRLDSVTYDPEQLLTDIAINSFVCAASLAAGVPGLLVRSISTAYQTFRVVQAAGRCEASVDTARVAVPTGASYDPNFKAGPVGDGSAARYLRTAARMPYLIGFENQPQATLPAAVVRVVDVLDPTVFDLQTLTLESVAWGRFNVPIPGGLQNYSTVVPVAGGLAVRVTVSLDAVTGVLTWLMETIDPLTGLPPTNSALGFLPPNRDGFEGQGYLAFSVGTKPGLPSGATLRNVASIYFDTNEPIVTDVWTNTLDTVAPTSRVHAAVQAGTTPQIDLAWGATDIGAGVASTQIFVSEDGGAYRLLGTYTTERSTALQGRPGATYRFYAQAVDRVGNQEAAKQLAEASVTLTSPPVETVVVTGQRGGGSASGWFSGLLLLAVAFVRRLHRRTTGLAV